MFKIIIHFDILGLVLRSFFFNISYLCSKLVMQCTYIVASGARSAVGRAIQTRLKGEFEKRKLYGKKRGLF